MTQTLFDNTTSQPADAGEPLAIVRQPAAIAELLATKGMAAEAAAWMAMQERWEDRRAEEAYNAAMIACQRDMPPVVRDGHNKQTNSTYPKLESIQEICQPIWLRHGFGLSFSEADSPLAEHKRTEVEVMHEAGARRFKHIDLPVDGIGPKGAPIGGMNRVQAGVSTMSYGQRKLTCLVFDIVCVNEDRDGVQECELIDEAHIATLREWIVTTNANEPIFLDFMGVKALAEIPQRDFAKALAALKTKYQRQGGKP